jgi:hypothetical protein
MTQPRYAPITEQARVRPAYNLRTPTDWRAERVAEIHSPEHPTGRELGIPGPDQGYALLLAEELYSDRLRLSQGISVKDAIHGCAAVACARAGRFGRAPVAKDVELALVLFGFLGEPASELVEWRTPLFQGAAHDYLTQRHIVDSVRPATLRLRLDQLTERMSNWQSLFVTGGAGEDGDNPDNPEDAEDAEAG